MTGTPRTQYPAIKGLSWHRHQYYSFFIPNNWHQWSWPDEREGVLYGPDLTDPVTVFAVDLKDLGTNISADDLDTLAEGFFESVTALPDCHLESSKKTVTGALLELEAKYTFQEHGQTRKRWVRLFYHGSRQIAMTAQGQTPEKYDYWLPWFFQAMMTAKIHSEKPALPF